MSSEGLTIELETTKIKTARRGSHCLPYNGPTKERHYAVRPGVEGFFITCDGGKESQARSEAIYLFVKV